MSLPEQSVRSLYRNILRREPDPGGLHAMMGKASLNDVAAAMMKSAEFISPICRWVFNYWLNREPVEAELKEWTANLVRLGTVQGDLELSLTHESLCRWSEGLDRLPLPPGQHQHQTLFNQRQYTNALIKRYFDRDAHGDLSIDHLTGQGEWKKYLNSLNYNASAPWIPRQIFEMVRAEPEGIRFRIAWNYRQYLGREPAPSEYRNWEQHLLHEDFCPFIPASPEGIKHGLSLDLSPVAAE